MIAILAALAAATPACGVASEAARATPLCRQSVAAPEYRHAISADRALLRRLNEGLRAPGLSLTVAAGGRIIWSVSCGYADSAGGFLSTADDLARFGMALTDGTLIDRESVAMMLRSQRTIGGEETGYGLGFGCTRAGSASSSATPGPSPEARRRY